MALFKYFSRDTSVPKLSSSLAQKEKEVVSDFASKAEKEAQHMGMTLRTQRMGVTLRTQRMGVTLRT